MLLGARGHELIERVLLTERLDLGQMHRDEQEDGRLADYAGEVEVRDVPRPLANRAAQKRVQVRLVCILVRVLEVRIAQVLQDVDPYVLVLRECMCYCSDEVGEGRAPDVRNERTGFADVHAHP